MKGSIPSDGPGPDPDPFLAAIAARLWQPAAAVEEPVAALTIESDGTIRARPELENFAFETLRELDAALHERIHRAVVLDEPAHPLGTIGPGGVVLVPDAGGLEWE